MIGDWKAVALKGLASLFENGHSELVTEKAAHEKQVNDLYAEIGKLTTQLAWLKKTRTANSGRLTACFLHQAPRGTLAAEVTDGKKTTST